jgi:hypothetical protein
MDAEVGKTLVAWTPLITALIAVVSFKTLFQTGIGQMAIADETTQATSIQKRVSTLPSAQLARAKTPSKSVTCCSRSPQLATRANAFDDTIDLRGFGIVYAILVGPGGLRFISGLPGSGMIGFAIGFATCRQARRERGSRRVRAGDGRRSTRPGHTCAVRVDTQIV